MTGRRSPTRTPASILDELRALLLHPSADKSAVGDLVRKYRESLSISTTALADRIRVAPQTVLRWERGEIKNAQLRKLEIASGAGPEPQSFVSLDSQYLAIRPFSYILKREQDAKVIWILKSQRKFLSGWPGSPRFQMLEIVRERRAQQRTLQINFVYPETPDNARNSFKKFRDFLTEQEQYREFRESFRGVRVPPNSACQLGLGITEVSMVIMEYDSESFDRLKRERDVFIETPVAVLLDPQDNVTSPTEFTVWTELPFQNVEDLWSDWQRLLTSELNVIE